MSNGVELGDPNCVWTKASNQPSEVTLLNRLSHPGELVVDSFLVTITKLRLSVNVFAINY